VGKLKKKGREASIGGGQGRMGRVVEGIREGKGGKGRESGRGWGRAEEKKKDEFEEIFPRLKRTCWASGFPL
jgi:hypothetical protein